MNWMLYLKTTETCNLNCKHCFTNGINGPKIYWNIPRTVNWLKRFAEHASKDDTVHCEFHGGEPFLVHPEEMTHVWNETKDLLPNATWGITSNLVLKLDDAHFEFIKGPLNNRIATSWDPKIRFTNNKQYALWHSNVKKILSNGTTVRLFVSVTSDTIKIKPIVLLRWIRRLGVQEVSFERLTGNGNANKFPEIFPSNIEQDAWFLEMHKQSEQYNAREWFYNDFLEVVYSKFETGFTQGGTFCRDCEEKIFTLNADGSISGCPNSAPEFQFGHINDSIESVINSPIRLHNMACEKSRNELCYSCDIFSKCGGDCHQLSWQDDMCGAPKSLMKHLNGNKKVWMIRENNDSAI